jgi:spore coat protein H
MRHALALVALLTACDDTTASDPADDDTSAATDTDSDTDGSSSDGCTHDAAVGWSEATHAKGVDGDYDLVMSDDRVMRIDITFCASDRQAMVDDLDDLMSSSGGGGGPGGGGGVSTAEDPLYVPVTVAVDGQTWPWVGIRYKGNSSLTRAYNDGSEKFPFRLHFDKYEDDHPEVEDQRFHGFKELKLSSAYLDDSLMRDKLMSDTMRDAGVPAAKGGFVEVWVDGGDGEGAQFWGLYAMFEDPAGEMLDGWFGDDDGSIYKADGDAADLSDASLSALQEAFEGKGGEEDHADLQAMVAALNADTADRAAWRADLEQVLDVDGALTWLAVDSLAGNWDGYGQMTHNYYLYADPAQDGRFAFVPWDFNEGYKRSGTRSAHSVSRDEVDAGWPLIRALLDDPVYGARYAELIEEQLDGPFSTAVQQARMDKYHALLAPYADAEAAPFTNLSSSGAFDESLEGGNESLYDVLDDAHDLGEAFLAR